MRLSTISGFASYRTMLPGITLLFLPLVKQKTIGFPDFLQRRDRVHFAFGSDLGYHIHILVDVTVVEPVQVVALGIGMVGFAAIEIPAVTPELMRHHVGVLALLLFVKLHGRRLRNAFDAADEENQRQEDKHRRATEKGDSPPHGIFGLAAVEEANAEQYHEKEQNPRYDLPAGPVDLGIQVGQGKRVFFHKRPHQVNPAAQKGHRNSGDAEDQADHDQSGAQPSVEPDFAFPHLVDGQRRQISDREVAHRGIMDYLGFDDGKQDQHHPEENKHPAFEIALVVECLRGGAHAAQRENGSRKAAHQQHRKMIPRKSAVPGIGCAEQPVVVLDEFGDEPRAMLQGFDAVPQERHHTGQQREQQKMPRVDEKLEPVEHPVYKQDHPHNQVGHRSFGKNAHAQQQSCADQVKILVFEEGDTAEIVLLPIKQNDAQQPQKNEQVEPRVDDARLEVQVWQHRTQIGSRPQQPEARIVKLVAHPVQKDQGKHTADGIRKAGRVFVDPPQVHGSGLHPEEKRRFFPERQKINVHTQVVFEDDHLAGNLREIDLVPVKQPDAAQKGQKKETGYGGDQKRIN